MVEKITNQNQIARDKLAEKINELIDVVDNLQTRLDYHELMHIRNYVLDDPTYHKAEPADQYAEQCKWCGKLCRFWDDSDEPENCAYGILVNIFDLHHEDCPFQCESNGEWYEYCEPVKPDSNIIYKGDK